MVSWLIVLIVIVYACILKMLIRLQYEGTLKCLGESVTGTEKGLEKRWRGLEPL